MFKGKGLSNINYDYQLNKIINMKNVFACVKDG